MGLGAGLAESAIESQLGFEGLRNALRQQQYQGLFDLLKGQQQQQQTTSLNLGSGLEQYLEGRSLDDIINDALNF